MDEIEGSNPSDPHRRLLRHTYQEGTGFLFPATRGGRPPGPPARGYFAALRLPAKAVRVANEDGIGAALALGVSRASLHRWRLRYAQDGREGLREHPRGPARAALPAWIEQAARLAHAGRALRPHPVHRPRL